FEMTQWYGILGPANLPQAAVEVLAAASTSAVKQPATNEKFSTDAVIGVGGGPAEFARFIAQEQQRWKPVVDRARIKPD
ncbi:MAG: tripartite tricarboxylate transporter substrate-binding protein, partial [Betaproteobacteria bacterium]